MTKQYNLKNIRALLTYGFDEKELRRLCHDMFDFRSVYDQLTKYTSKAELIDQLLEYTGRKLLFEVLLAWAKENNPTRYEEHQPYYDPTDSKSEALRQLTFADDEKRIEAAEMLGRIGDPVAIPQLEAQLLQEENSNVAYWIAKMIGEIGGKQAEETLIRLKNQLIDVADPYTLLGIDEALEFLKKDSVNNI